MKDEENQIDIELEDTEEVVDEATTTQKLKTLREKLKASQKEAAENLAGWQRARADLVNKEKQLQQEKVEIIKFANANLIDSILPTLDNFELAKRNKEVWEKVDQNWRTGIEYIFQNLKNSLLDSGLKEITPKQGEHFDVNTMETTEEVAGNEDNDHKVAELVQTGYTLGEKLLRPAKVKIYIKK